MKVFLAAQVVNTYNLSTPGSRVEALKDGVSLGSVVRTCSTKMEGKSPVTLLSLPTMVLGYICLALYMGAGI